MLHEEHDQWIKLANTEELRKYLEFCADTRVFPCPASLSSFQLKNDEDKHRRRIATYLYDHPKIQQLYELITHLDNLIQEFKSIDQSGDYGPDAMTAPVTEAQEWLYQLKKEVS